MALFNIPAFEALKAKLQWHTKRQGVLAENIAHADMPGYVARDLKPFSVEMMRQKRPQHASTPVAAATGIAVTNAKHIASPSIGGIGNPQSMTGFEVTPSGNNSSMEEQMVLAAQNQVDHNAAAALYEKIHDMLRAAARRS